MKPPEPEQIAKLPKWAQEYIVRLERDRDDARRTEKAYRDEQTPSPFFQEYQGNGLNELRYIQAHTICVQWRGVRLRVDAHGYGNRGEGIHLQWEDENRSMAECAFIPQSFQSARIVSKKDMWEPR